MFVLYVSTGSSAQVLRVQPNTIYTHYAPTFSPSTRRTSGSLPFHNAQYKWAQKVSLQFSFFHHLNFDRVPLWRLGQCQQQGNAALAPSVHV